MARTKTQQSPASASKASTSKLPAAAPQQPRTIAGFHILPLSIPTSSVASSSSSSSSSPTQHYLYLRPHEVTSSKDTLPKGRTLFLVNLPVDTTEGHLRSLFEKAGRVEEVRFRRRRGGSSTREQELDALTAGEGSEDDDNEEGADGMALDGAAAASKTAMTAAEEKKAKYKNTKKPTGPQAPALHSLPLLDPRKDAVFLETGSSAHVVFLEETSVKRALALSAEGKPRKWVDPQVQLLRSAQKEAQGNDDEGGEEDGYGARRKSRPSTAREAKLASVVQKPPAPTGLAYFLQSYDSHHPSLAEVKRHADSVVKRYTFFRSHPQLDPERQSSSGGLGARVGEGGIKIASYGPGGEPLDEDGFTIVLPGGKYGKSLGAPGTAGEGGVDQPSSSSVRFARQSQMDMAALALKARKQEQASEGLEDFYRFQNRERRKEKLAEMRRQFEEDREKVEEMKKKGGAGSRRFKPY
ncbi:hypothetical protein BCV69DRAFT_284376 [Microstroma glucosiphilum]|uniref:RRM domain-containing protein n=1 Tax=Pseudomicrostroma glucosiphilum TaxID=1684307 RepID=A0A316U8C2_9BASI|nr:hypothetical protein BCV69DRAFT_284376 [Pseudomicrostroma glucosiphilum]PWN19225.1 hypothetical protein BCV69DRAFT_284376 [Pseudomicrostroma glucosiphilum]